MKRLTIIATILISLISGYFSCSPGNKHSGIEYWVTYGDSSSLLEKLPGTFAFGTSNDSFPVINIDTSIVFQTIDGFGYTLTGGSAWVFNRLSSGAREKLLNELFGNSDSSVKISYLRISIGASDLNDHVFSYDDIPAGQTDTSLEHFTLEPDKKDLIPLLKEILAINPAIKIFLSQLGLSHGDGDRC